MSETKAVVVVALAGLGFLAALAWMSLHGCRDTVERLPVGGWQAGLVTCSNGARASIEDGFVRCTCPTSR